MKTGENYIEICFKAIPASIEEFKEVVGDNKDALKVAAQTILALAVYPKKPELAIEMINYLKGPKPLSVYEISFLKDRFRGKEYLMNSYFEGASPENNYEVTGEYKVKIYTNNTTDDLKSEGYKRLYVQSSGADSKREIRVRIKESTQEWFLWEYFILADIRKPQAQDPWA